MANFSTDWPFWLAAALLGVLSLFTLYRALFHNRSRGRKRCPKCWYDMSGADTSRPGGLVCPECGRDAKREKRLFRTRRRRRWAVVGVVLGFVSCGLLKTPEVRRDGWVRSVPTWALLAAFPRAIRLDGDMPPNVMTAMEKMRFVLGGTPESLAARAATAASSTKAPSVARLIYLETFRRYFAGEMWSPEARWLARWAHRRESHPESGSFERLVLRKIAWRGWMNGMVPADDIRARLEPILLRMIRVRERWPENVPIAFDVDISALSPFAIGTPTVLVRDLKDGGEVRLEPTRFNPWGASVIDKKGWRPSPPKGALSPRIEGESPRIQVEVLSGAARAPGDAPESPFYSQLIDLPIEIVSSMALAAPPVECSRMDFAISALAPRVYRDGALGGYIYWDRAQLIEALQREHMTLAVDVEVWIGDHRALAEPLLVSPANAANLMPSGIGLPQPLTPVDDPCLLCDWRLRLVARPDLAMLDFDGDRRWDGDVELMIRSIDGKPPYHLVSPGR